jgi:hypothetical protein
MDPTFGEKILHTYSYKDDKSDKYGKRPSGDLINSVDITGYPMRNPVFEHYGALILANMDAIFKFTGHMTSIVNPVIDDDFNDMYYYLDLCCGKGGFTEYMIYRRPLSKGGGITLNNENVYNASGNFTLCRGGYGDGDILSGTEWVADFFSKRLPHVRVALCDGVINEKPLDMQYSDFIGNPNRDCVVELPELDLDHTQRYLLEAQAHIAMSLTQNNGMIIFRLSNPLNWEEGRVIQNISYFFEKITLLRPISAKIGEVYLICEGYNYDVYDFAIPEVPMKRNFAEWLIRGAELVKSPAILPKNYADRCLIKWGLSSGGRKIEKNKEMKSLALEIFGKWSEGGSNDGWEDLFIKYFELRGEDDKGDLEEESEPIIFTKDHMYDLTTKRGTRVSLVKNRVNSYLSLISGDWKYLDEIIDWYAPFGFIGFRRLENEYLIDGLANPFTRCSKKWYSIFGENGSSGTIFDSTSVVNCQIFVYPSVALMDKIYELYKKDKIAKMIVYCPNWEGHSLFGEMKDVKLKMPDLVNYTTGECFKMDIPYVRGVLEIHGDY